MATNICQFDKNLVNGVFMGNIYIGITTNPDGVNRPHNFHLILSHEWLF